MNTYGLIPSPMEYPRYPLESPYNLWNSENPRNALKTFWNTSLIPWNTPEIPETAFIFMGRSRNHLERPCTQRKSLELTWKPLIHSCNPLKTLATSQLEHLWNSWNALDTALQLPGTSLISWNTPDDHETPPKSPEMPLKPLEKFWNPPETHWKPLICFCHHLYRHLNALKRHQMPLKTRTVRISSEYWTGLWLSNLIFSNEAVFQFQKNG